MLWVLKRIISMKRSFWAPKTYAKNYGEENIHNFLLKFFVYLNLWSLHNITEYIQVIGLFTPE